MFVWTIVFLGLNEKTLDANPDELAATVLGAADGSIDKSTIALYLKQNLR